MKIVISSENKDLESNMSSVFGRCNYFIFAEIKENKISNVNAIENKNKDVQGGAGISAAKDVAEQGAEAVITANVGPRAIDVFKQFNIKVYQATGIVKEVIERFIANKLKEFN